MESPSIEESILHYAIMQAINRFRGSADDIKQILKKNIVSVLAESSNSAYKANTYILKERIDSLQAEMIQLVMQGVSNGVDRYAIEAECESKTLELKK